MNGQRADVVLVDFPYSSGTGSKVRPALVVQNDRDNVRLTQVLIEVATAEGQQTGLLFDSVVNCVNLVTLDKNKIVRKLGVLADVLMQKVNDAL